MIVIYDKINFFSPFLSISEYKNAYTCFSNRQHEGTNGVSSTLTVIATLGYFSLSYFCGAIE